MSRKKSRLEATLDWSPLITGVATAVTTKVLGNSDWSLFLLASQLVIITTAFLRFQSQWNKHRSEMENTVDLLKNEVRSDSYLNGFFTRLLQSVLFCKNDIDEDLWLRLSETLRSESAQRIDEAIRKVAEVLDSKKLTTRDNHVAYMQALYDYVSEYRAVCVVSDHRLLLDPMYAREKSFIFSAPLLPENRRKKLYRLFQLNEGVVPMNLDDELRSKLLQQINAKSIELKWRNQPHADCRDFGIYGKVAVGEFRDNQNTILLSDYEAREKRKAWQRLWDDPESFEITPDTLGMAANLGPGPKRARPGKRESPNPI